MDPAGVLGIVAGVLGVLGVLWRIGRAVFAAGGDARQLTTAMRANTLAIETLSTELRTANEKLSGLDDRVTRLEQQKAS